MDGITWYSLRRNNISNGLSQPSQPASQPASQPIVTRPHFRSPFRPFSLVKTSKTVSQTECFVQFLARWVHHSTASTAHSRYLQCYDGPTWPKRWQFTHPFGHPFRPFSLVKTSKTVSQTVVFGSPFQPRLYPYAARNGPQKMSKSDVFLPNQSNRTGTFATKCTGPMAKSTSKNDPPRPIAPS